MFFKSKNKNEPQEYASTIAFAGKNMPQLRSLLAPTSNNDTSKRLQIISQYIGSLAILLCYCEGDDKYRVISTSLDSTSGFTDRFMWGHSTPVASGDATAVISKLPFPSIGAKGFISVPIKDSRNVITGLVMALFSSEIVEPETATQLLHILAQPFEAEMRCEKQRLKVKDIQGRMDSINQDIELLQADLKNAQQLAGESTQLKTAFLTNLSHEIRTPLNAVLGFIDLFPSAETEEERDEYRNIIKENSAMLLKVIDDTMELSKQQLTYIFKPAAPQSLNLLLDGISKRFTTKIKESGKDIKITLHCALEAPTDIIWNSDEIITKVLNQLLDNAIKFTESGTIDFGYEKDHMAISFFVIDTGVGIQPGKENEIFEMFSTGNNTLKKDVNGCGIGLALAQKYINLIDGKIWVEKGREKGAAFYFSIPLNKL